MDALLVASATSARRLQEIGALIGGIGALALILGGFIGLRPGNTIERRRERSAYIVAGILIGVGFLLTIVGLHSG